VAARVFRQGAERQVFELSTDDRLGVSSSVVPSIFAYAPYLPS
jgi:hypothetical protein